MPTMRVAQPPENTGDVRASAGSEAEASQSGSKATCPQVPSQTYGSGRVAPALTSIGNTPRDPGKR